MEEVVDQEEELAEELELVAWVEDLVEVQGKESVAEDTGVVEEEDLEVVPEDLVVVWVVDLAGG